MQTLIKTCGCGGNTPLIEEVGTVLTIGGFSVDCAARQTDSAQLVHLSLGANSQVVEGLGKGWTVAAIEIPARLYTKQEVEDSDPISGTPMFADVPIPLDMKKVAVTLFKLPTPNPANPNDPTPTE